MPGKPEGNRATEGAACALRSEAADRGRGDLMTAGQRGTTAPGDYSSFLGLSK